MKPANELLASFDHSWEEFSAAWKKARSKSSEKSIHDLRVSARRLIATLELTRALSKQSEIPKLQRRFKKALKSMGPLRDLQVQIQGIGQLRQKNDLILEFKEDLERQEKRQIGDIHDELKRNTKRQLTKGVKEVRSEFARLSEKAPEERISRGVARLLTRKRNEFLRARKQFQPSDAETLHEMRIALKKLRYTVEAAQPVLHNSAKAHAREMQALQQLLGDTRDAELLHNRLESWAKKKGKKIAIAPALDALKEKRESLLQKIIKSSTAMEAIFPKQLGPSLKEKTQAMEMSNPSSLAVANVVAVD